MEMSEVYEKLKPDLIRFAKSIARHGQEADDLVQEAVLKSLNDENLLTLPEYKQRAWFFRVMKNQMIDERRKEKKLSPWEDDLDFHVPGMVSNHIEMVELLSSLTPELSDIVFKRYWLGLTSQEIGKQLSIPSATVRYKLCTAVKRLRAKLEMEE
ncbi:RNA polymerase sigma factor [Alteribacter populi]|uniref:RNA polymerase sigma factor n=1 Tax=Alteribacter populi TaxID=2011011 RepID=UPI000BBB3D96|nr:RNA polymerase sigma factor [Alteribacter populi]